MGFFENLGKAASSVPVVGGAIQSTINAIDGAISSRRQYKNQKKLMGLQYDYQSQLQQQAFQNSLDAWRMQNEYNDPSAVRDRLEQAGYNINGMSGVATPAGGLSSVSSPSVGLGQSSATRAGAFDVAALRNSASQTKLNDALAEKALADAQLTSEKVNTELSTQQLQSATTALQKAMEQNTLLMNEWQVIKNDIANITKYDQIEQISTHVQETIARTQKIYSELSLDQQRSVDIQSNIQLTIARTLLAGVEAEAKRAGIAFTEAQTTEVWQNVSNMIEMQELYFPQAKAMQEWSKVVYPVISGLYTAIKDTFGDKPQSNGFTAGQVLKLLYGIANAE